MNNMDEIKMTENKHGTFCPYEKILEEYLVKVDMNNGGYITYDSRNYYYVADSMLKIKFCPNCFKYKLKRVKCKP